MPKGGLFNDGFENVDDYKSSEKSNLTKKYEDLQK